MINKNIQEKVRTIIKRQKGNPYPCSNQVVGNYIFIKDNLFIKIEKLINNYNFRIIRQYKNRVLLEKDGIQWEAFIMKENQHGRRAYRAIIDPEFSETFFNQVIWPMLYNYCKEVIFLELHDN